MSVVHPITKLPFFVIWIETEHCSCAEITWDSGYPCFWQLDPATSTTNREKVDINYWVANCASNVVKIGILLGHLPMHVPMNE